MCTDLHLVKLPDRHVSGRTLDFTHELQSRVQVVPRGQPWTATQTGTTAPPLSWTNTLGFVGMDAFGFDWAICDGLNEASLSLGTLWLPETRLPQEPPAGGETPAIDFINLATWLLGTCATVADVRRALAGVQIWNAPLRLLWPAERPMPDMIKPLLDWAFPEHLSIHDAHGGDLVVEFLDGATVLHDNVNHQPAQLPRPDQRRGGTDEPDGHGGQAGGERHRAARAARRSDPAVALRAGDGDDPGDGLGEERAGRRQPGLPLSGPGQRPTLHRRVRRLHAVVRRPRSRQPHLLRTQLRRLDHRRAPARRARHRSARREVGAASAGGLSGARPSLSEAHRAVCERGALSRS